MCIGIRDAVSTFRLGLVCIRDDLIQQIGNIPNMGRGVRVDGSTLAWRVGRMMICKSLCVLGRSCSAVLSHGGLSGDTPTPDQDEPPTSTRLSALQGSATPWSLIIDVTLNSLCGVAFIKQNQ